MGDLNTLYTFLPFSKSTCICKQKKRGTFISEGKTDQYPNTSLLLKTILIQGQKKKKEKNLFLKIYCQVDIEYSEW